MCIANSIGVLTLTNLITVLSVGLIAVWKESDISFFHSLRKTTFFRNPDYHGLCPSPFLGTARF